MYFYLTRTEEDGFVIQTMQFHSVKKQIQQFFTADTKLFMMMTLVFLEIAMQEI